MRRTVRTVDRRQVADATPTRKGTRRSNDTHESSTDADARLFKKSRKSPAILHYHGHILMENRSGRVVGAVVSHADGFAERASALWLLDCAPGGHAKTVGADKTYDTRDFVNDCRARDVTPYVARNDDRHGGSAIDGRTSRHAGYRVSQVIRKRIEEQFGWGKTVGRIRPTVYKGIRRVDQHFRLTMVASNLTRLARMPGVVPQGSGAMSRNARRRRQHENCPQKSPGEPVIQQQIARANPVHTALVVLTRFFLAAC
ncbi:hypothetical protein P3T21_007503 [Paraburkholderia sp. GAS334]